MLAAVKRQQSRRDLQIAKPYDPEVVRRVLAQLDAECAAEAHGKPPKREISMGRRWDGMVGTLSRPLNFVFAVANGTINEVIGARIKILAPRELSDD